MLCLPDKLAFVGFKGSFRPHWVRMTVDDERVKLHQVLPIPIVKTVKLWKQATHPRKTQTLSSTTVGRAVYACTRPPDPNDQSKMSMCYVILQPLPADSIVCDDVDVKWLLDRVVYCLYLSFREEKVNNKHVTFLVLVPLCDVCHYVLPRNMCFSKYVEKRFQIVNVVSLLLL